MGVRTHLRSAVLVAALAALLVACGADDTADEVVGDDDTEATEGGEAAADSDGDPILIGTVLPMSGPFAAPGQEILRGYQIAIEEWGGTVAGRPIELVTGDGMAPEDVIAEVDRLATRQEVDMFVATYASPASEAGSEAATRHGKFWYETHATANDLTERGLENFVRATLRGIEFGEGAATYIIEELASELGTTPGGDDSLHRVRGQQLR
jgi:ABC-type branched-subunit amino acid transport system substrate-binding protein